VREASIHHRHDDWGGMNLAYWNVEEILLQDGEIGEFPDPRWIQHFSQNAAGKRRPSVFARSA